MSELAVLLGGRKAGAVEQRTGGDLAFTYDHDWRDEAGSYPLSLSLPLARRAHGDGPVRAFLEGLLPDNRQVLERWGRRFQVSPRNPFALLTHMGEDCAGAVQLVRPDRVDAISEPDGAILWLSEDEVSNRLRDLVENHGTGRFAADEGQFSLAGAQPKTALFFDGSRWGIPSGSTPTTHILKPPAQPEFDDFAINEHFCLNLAEELGIKAARSTVRVFGGQPAIVVERYDRLRIDSEPVTRIHQEDACQALGVPPWQKYENEGGPGGPQIVELLVRESDDPETDVGVFLDTLVLNWIIAGSDAHAKNYSVLIRPGSVRLAPMYDLLSALPYDREIPYRRIRLAMRVDREYLVWKIRARHWQGLAARCDLDSGPVLQRAIELAAEVPRAAHAVADKIRQERLSESAVNRLVEGIVDHSRSCLEVLKRGT